MDEREPKFIKYSTYFNHRVGKTGGGLETLVRNDLILYRKMLKKFGDGQLQVKAVKIINDSDKIDVLNIYNPCCNIGIKEFEYYIQNYIQIAFY